MRVVLIPLLLACLSSVNIAQDPVPKGGNHVICYYTSWSAGRKSPYNFTPEDLDPFLCTHVIFAFAIFDTDKYDFDKTQGDFTQLQPRLVALKQRNPELKIMFAAGGWREGTTGFAVLTKNEENRSKFAKLAVKFLRESNFDGIDLNWQHPTFREGGTPEDKENYVFLAQTLRNEFDKEAMETGNPKLILAISITQNMKALPAYDIRNFNTYMDFISVLCYDYVFSYTSSALHHAPLYAIPDSPNYEEDKALNVDTTIQYFLQQADPGKLVLGIPTYGRTRSLVDPKDTDIGAEADGPGMAGTYTGEKGFLAYFEICSLINNEKWTVNQTRPLGNVGPHAFKDNQWVGYDDEDMVRTKAKYARERGLAGVVFWTIDYDDFLGTCGKRRFPLINAAKDELNMIQDETIMVFPTERPRNVVMPPSRPPVPPPPTRRPIRPRPPMTPSPTRRPEQPKPPPTEYRPPAVMTTPPSLEEAYQPDRPDDTNQYDQPEGNDLQSDLVEELIQLIEKAGGMKNFCRILREAKTTYKKNRPGYYPMRRYDDMIVDGPNIEPLRLLISNSSITIQELNVYGRP